VLGSNYQTWLLGSLGFRDNSLLNSIYSSALASKVAYALRLGVYMGRLE